MMAALLRSATFKAINPLGIRLHRITSIEEHKADCVERHPGYETFGLHQGFGRLPRQCIAIDRGARSRCLETRQKPCSPHYGEFPRLSFRE